MNVSERSTLSPRARAGDDPGPDAVDPSRERGYGRLAAIRHRRGTALLGAAAVAGLAGIVAGILFPRGPVTTEGALAWLVGALIVGVAVGMILGLRWSVLLALVTFAIALEIARAGTPGPTVEAFQPGSTYGLIAIVVGRGFTYLLAVMPMLVGASLGAALGAHFGRPGVRAPGRLGWGLTSIGVLALLAIGYGLLQPATTAPILGVDGRPLDGSIAELTSVRLGGHDQALMIRGRSVENPVLLHLAGGPGGTDLGAMRADASLEGDFIVVTWEQRGTGKSYASLDPVETLTLERMVADTIELTEYLRERFDEERIYVHGNSWGSTLGVLAVQRRPDLFHAFVGSGQMVSQRATDIMFYEDTLAWAEATGRDDLAATLRANGPPPYASILAYEPALSHEREWNAYPEYDTDLLLPATLFVPENTLVDRVNGLRAFLDTFSILYPQLQDIDFRDDVARLDVPVTIVAGAHEARGRAVLVDEWLASLEAPSIRKVVFEHSGHRPSFEEPAAFVQVMRDVLAATGMDGGSPAPAG